MNEGDAKNSADLTQFEQMLQASLFPGLEEPYSPMRPQPSGRRNDGLHWLGLPVHTFRGTIEEVSQCLPAFGRRPFVMMPGDSLAAAVNLYYDVIVRLPTADFPFEFPLGIVSKSYQLVQHWEALAIASQALVAAEIDPRMIHAELTITENGERARFSFEFPDDETYSFQIRDHDEMRLRFECFNSVDGSMRFAAVLGWLRFVCSNGLVIGATLANLWELHRKQLSVSDIAVLLKQALRSVKKDRVTYKRWLNFEVTSDRLTRWADGPLKELWGTKAATRVLHISRSGRDVILVGDPKKAPPSKIEVARRGPVPGALAPAQDAFAVSQALSWIAGQRRDLAEQLQWRGKIPRLIQRLITLV